jgi:hypothetical protein
VVKAVVKAETVGTRSTKAQATPAGYLDNIGKTFALGRCRHRRCCRCYLVFRRGSGCIVRWLLVGLSAGSHATQDLSSLINILLVTICGLGLRLWLGLALCGVLANQGWLCRLLVNMFCYWLNIDCLLLGCPWRSLWLCILCLRCITSGQLALPRCNI